MVGGGISRSKLTSSVWTTGRSRGTTGRPTARTAAMRSAWITPEATTGAARAPVRAARRRSSLARRTVSIVGRIQHE